jgi:hypothetical protein
MHSHTVCVCAGLFVCTHACAFAHVRSKHACSVPMASIHSRAQANACRYRRLHENTCDYMRIHANASVRPRTHARTRETRDANTSARIHTRAPTCALLHSHARARTNSCSHPYANAEQLPPARRITQAGIRTRTHMRSPAITSACRHKLTQPLAQAPIQAHLHIVARGPEHRTTHITKRISHPLHIVQHATHIKHSSKHATHMTHDICNA